MAFTDIGAGAIDRNSNISNAYTIIDLTNPANANGRITSVEVWAETNLTGFRVGTFYLVSGTTYKCRASQTIGAVTAGSKQIFPVSIEVKTGDFIGFYCDTGWLEASDTSIGSGIMFVSGEYIDPDDQTVYTFDVVITITLYGTNAQGSKICLIAFDSAPYDAIPVWDDVSSDLRGLSIRRGRQHALDRMEPGTVVVTLNNRHYYYYPNNLLSPYSPNVLPGKRLNISVYYNAVYEIFTGYITEYRPNWQSKSGIGAVMEITAVGLIGNLALLLINDGTGFVEELSGTRIDNVLDKLSVNIGRDLATGQSTMQASGALVNENAKEHSDIVQRSELGYVFEAGDGDIQFHDRHTRLKAPYVTSSATFSDTPGLMRYIDVKLAYDDKFIYNDVRIQAVSGTEQVAVDSTSGTAYGKRSLSRTGLLMMTDADALAQAQYLLSRYKDPALRAKSLLVYPDADPDNLYPKVLGFDIGHRITLQLSQADIDTDYHIEGVNHDWDAGQNKWVTKWQLSDADNQKYWVLGVVGFTEIGQTTRLAY